MKNRFFLVCTLICLALILTVLVSGCDSNKKTYDEAVKLFEQGDYESAKVAFAALGGYKDSEQRLDQIEKAKQYEKAVALFDKGDYESAKDAFEALGSYEDSEQKLSDCAAKIEEMQNSVLQIAGYEDRPNGTIQVRSGSVSSYFKISNGVAQNAIERVEIADLPDSKKTLFVRVRAKETSDLADINQILDGAKLTDSKGNAYDVKASTKYDGDAVFDLLFAVPKELELVDLTLEYTIPDGKTVKRSLADGTVLDGTEFAQKVLNKQ